jgi:ribosomal protein L7/L12
MITSVQCEKSYTVTYFAPQSKNSFGISVSVTGDKKLKVIREAKEILNRAMLDSKEIKDKYTDIQ